MDPCERLLRELIALPSVNPAFLPPGDPRAGEEKMAGFLLAHAAAGGLDVELRPVRPHRPNLLARLSPSGAVRHRVALVPHTDTVGEEFMAEALFQPVLKGGRLYGRGACDTKGSAAAMLTALLELAKHGPRPLHTEILFVAVVDEERGQLGSRTLVRERFRADLALVGEPTRLQVVTAHKGVLWFKLETRGRAAHGARPELGQNAVYQMAKIVECLATEYVPSLSDRQHPLLGQPTLNVGAIQGGRQPNIVPDRCVISLDRRTLPGETNRGVLGEIQTLLRRRKLAAHLLPPGTEPSLPLETDAQNPLVRRLMEAAGQNAPAGAVFFSDASILAHGGTPSVLFGPGDIAQAHTAREYISLRSLQQATRVLRRFLGALP